MRGQTYTDKTREAILASRFLTATSHGVVISREWRLDEWQEPSSLDSHLDSLPTLQEVLAQARQSDGEWEHSAKNARRALRERLRRLEGDGELSRLTAERIFRGWTQAELGEKVGMAQANISRLESANTLTVEMAKRLASALGIDYKDLL